LTTNDKTGFESQEGLYFLDQFQKTPPQPSPEIVSESTQIHTVVVDSIVGIDDVTVKPAYQIKTSFADPYEQKVQMKLFDRVDTREVEILGRQIQQDLGFFLEHFKSQLSLFKEYFIGHLIG